MSAERADWIAVFGHREGLAWVLTHSRLAFAAERGREVGRLHSGDRVLIYAARGVFGRGSKPGGLVAAGEALSDVCPLEPPVRIAEREFALGAALDLVGLTPFGTVSLLQPLLDELRSFPRNHPSAWQPMLRRPLLKLEPGDFDRLMRELQPLLAEPQQTVAGYQAVPT